MLALPIRLNINDHVTSIIHRPYISGEMLHEPKRYLSLGLIVHCLSVSLGSFLGALKRYRGKEYMVWRQKPQ